MNGVKDNLDVRIDSRNGACGMHQYIRLRDTITPEDMKVLEGAIYRELSRMGYFK